MKIVITGVTRGLGRALAEHWIAAGHTVAGCGRSGEEILALRLAHGAPHEFAVVDVAQDTKVALWAEHVLGALGPPDFLINNAAIMNRLAPLWEQDDREIARILDVNVRGVANIIRHFAPAMIAAKHGVIVNLSSGWGRSTSPQVAPYCATKFAIEGLTQALAAELPAGLAAIPLNPGVINTAMLQASFGASADGYPKAEAWARRAGPFILKLGPRDNGRPLSVDGFAE